MGFVNVWAYEGGMNEWFHSGASTDGLCKQTYLAEPVERPAEAGAGKAREIRLDELKKMVAESCVCE